MERWLRTILRRLRALAAFRKVWFTEKAREELLSLRLDEEDALDILRRLNREDFVERISSGRTGEQMYVFKPRVGGVLAYVKVVLRGTCVVVSFHEDRGVTDEEAQ